MMKEVKYSKNIAVMILGLVLFAAGSAIGIIFRDASGMMRTVPFVCIGIGIGLAGGNMGTLIRKRMIQKGSRAAKQAEIDERDERSIAIRNTAKAKAYDLMLIVYSALMMAFALMQVELYVILALIAAYLFIVIAQIYYSSKLQKEM